MSSRVAASMKQSDLFENVTDLPEGFRYTPKMISPAEEGRLVGMLKTLRYPGSIPCDLITGIAVGPLRNIISAFAASGTFELVLTPAVNVT